MNSYRYISFDYFMTLVEVDQPFEQIKRCIEETYQGTEKKLYSTFIREYARLYATKKYILGKRLLQDSMAQVVEKFQLEDKSKEFEQFIFQLFTESKAYEDSRDVIERLRIKYKVGLLTNADNDILMESIKKQNFSFDFIISSEDAGWNKPYMQFFQYAYEKLGCNKKDIIHIGDSQVDDIFGGGQMGMDTIWINRKDETLKEEIVKPIAIVRDLKDVIGELM